MTESFAIMNVSVVLINRRLGVIGWLILLVNIEIGKLLVGKIGLILM